MSLRTSVLNGSVSRPKPAARSAARVAGLRGDHRQHGAGPRAVRAGAVEPVEAPVDLGPVGGGEVGGRGQHAAGVGLVDPVEPDPVHGQVGIAAQLGAHRVGVGEAGAPGVGLGDPGGVDHVDRVDLDHLAADDPVPGAVAVAGHDLAAASTAGR